MNIEASCTEAFAQLHLIRTADFADRHPYVWVSLKALSILAMLVISEVLVIHFSMGLRHFSQAMGSRNMTVLEVGLCVAVPVVAAVAIAYKRYYLQTLKTVDFSSCGNDDIS